MNIFLIRHGESEANIGGNADQHTIDRLVPLTSKGVQQAYDAGVFLADYCQKNNISLEKARIWHSPYYRAKETAKQFNKSLQISEIREDITLSEQSFGDVDGIPKEQWKLLYPNKYKQYMRYVEQKEYFYAKPPGGESPHDIAIKIKQFFDTIWRDYYEHDIDTVFIFTHGTTLRAFLLRWCHYNVDWYNQEENPGNCWIRRIESKEGCELKDYGYININS
jgi:broad specificity phosphatase PhoE